MAAPTDSFEFPRTGKKARNRAVVAAMTNKQSKDEVEEENKDRHMS